MSRTAEDGSDIAGVPSVHVLTLKLTEIQYRALRRYVIDAESLSGRRVTHQEVLLRAMSDYLVAHE